jgi:hypothetical protein
MLLISLPQPLLKHRSDDIRRELEDLDAIPQIASLKENLTSFVVQVHKILKTQAGHNIGTPDKRKAQILEDLGFSQMTTTDQMPWIVISSTVCLIGMMTSSCL